MKAFIANRVSGEDMQRLTVMVKGIRESFRAINVDTYSTIIDEPEFIDKGMNARQIMDHAFARIRASDFLFVVQTSNEKSEGMLIEVGYCVGRKMPILAAVNTAVSGSYLADMATAAFRWDDFGDLSQKIHALDMKTLFKESDE